MADSKIALLIDAENISAQYAGYIIDEIESMEYVRIKEFTATGNASLKTRWRQRSESTR